MLVSDLIQNVRDQLLEQNTDPITDQLICNRLNDAYRFVYNSFAKSNDNMFGEDMFLQINAAQSEYELPKNLWNKRIETFEAPSPNNNSNSPTNVLGWEKIPKTERQQMAYYESPRTKTQIPTMWAQYGNKIRILPPPANSYRARLFFVPKLTKLAPPIGRVVKFQQNKIYLDNSPSAEFYVALSAVDSAFVSVSDFETGRLKATYPIVGTQGTAILLGETTRTLYLGEPVLSVKTFDVFSISKVANILTATIGTHSVKVGDLLELSQESLTSVYRSQDLTAQVLLPIPIPKQETVNLSSYDSGLQRGIKIVQTTPTSISWVDSNFKPLFVNGYKSELTPVDVAVANVEVLPNNVVRLNMGSFVAGLTSAGGAWGLKVGDVVRISLNGVTTGIPSFGTQLYLPAVISSELAVNVYFATGAGLATYLFTGTANLGQLTTSFTGIPPLFDDVLPGVAKVVAKISTNTPYSLGTNPEQKDNPDAYDTANKIQLDDIVTVGVSTGCSILSEAFSEYLWKHSLLAVRGSLNENDPEISKQMKELQLAITGDTAGRVLGRRIERVGALGSNYRRPLRG
jgi:hypothetical protein